MIEEDFPAEAAVGRRLAGRRNLAARAAEVKEIDRSARGGRRGMARNARRWIFAEKSRKRSGEPVAGNAQ